MGIRPHPSCPRPLFLFRSPSSVEMLWEKESAPHRILDRDHYRFDRHAPVSIQMPDGLIEELSKDVFPLASLVLHSARKLPRLRRLTALLTNRWFNVSVALDSPGRAVVCGWGSHSCYWASVSSNLAGWDGCCSRANDFRFHQSLSIYYCQKPLSAPVGSCLIVFTSRMREEPVAAYKASHLNDELAVASASSWR